MVTSKVVLPSEDLGRATWGELMEKKKVAYFDNNTQKIKVREVTRTEMIKRYLKRTFKRVTE